MDLPFWTLTLPGTYIPRKEVEVVQTIQSSVIRHNQAIRLRARKECQDREDHARVTGQYLLFYLLNMMIQVNASSYVIPRMAAGIGSLFIYFFQKIYFNSRL